MPDNGNPAKTVGFIPFPRPKGRGHIEGTIWTGDTNTATGYFHGRKVVATLKAGQHRLQELPDPDFHGRKVVATLKAVIVARQAVLGCEFPRPKGRGHIEGVICRAALSIASHISTAERSWPH